MCQRCGHDLLSHYTWFARVEGATCRECRADHAYVPPARYSVTSDGREPVLALTASLVDR